MLVSEEMVKTMKPGSVIVDLAAEQGGNCPLTKANEVIEVHGVTLMGHTQSAERAGGRCVEPLCAQPLQFRQPVRRQEDGAASSTSDDEIVKGAADADGGDRAPALQPE